MKILKVCLLINLLMGVFNFQLNATPINLQFVDDKSYIKYNLNDDDLLILQIDTSDKYDGFDARVIIYPYYTLMKYDYWEDILHS